MLPVWAHVEKGDPVAVVYYECRLNAKGECTPGGDLYYVHNAVVVEASSARDGGVRVSHVSAWPQGAGPVSDELYICGPDRAAQWAQGTAKPATPTCHVTGGAAASAKEHTWVTKAMYAYSVAEPIAWKVTKGGRSEDPHNGIFKFFQRSGTPEADIRKIISKAGGEVTVQGPFTLGFEHYVNNNPDRFRKEDGRTAYRNWGKFTLQSEEIAVTDPHDSIAIRSRWE